MKLEAGQNMNSGQVWDHSDGAVLHLDHLMCKSYVWILLSKSCNKTLMTLMPGVIREPGENKRF